MINIKQIYDDALKDPALFAKIDVDAIIDSLESDGSTDYLETESLSTIQKTVYDCLREHGITQIEYTAVLEINQLKNMQKKDMNLF
jgi:hypothetical protein